MIRAVVPAGPSTARNMKHLHSSFTFFFTRLVMSSRSRHPRRLQRDGYTANGTAGGRARGSLVRRRGKDGVRRRLTRRWWWELALTLAPSLFLSLGSWLVVAGDSVEVCLRTAAGRRYGPSCAGFLLLDGQDCWGSCSSEASPSSGRHDDNF